MAERYNNRLKLCYEDFNNKLYVKGKKTARKVRGRNKRKHEEDGMFSIAKISNQLTNNSMMEEDGVLNIDKICKQLI